MYSKKYSMATKVYLNDYSWSSFYVDCLQHRSRLEKWRVGHVITTGPRIRSLYNNIRPIILRPHSRKMRITFNFSDKPFRPKNYYEIFTIFPMLTLQGFPLFWKLLTFNTLVCPLDNVGRWRQRARENKIVVGFS